MVLVRPTTHVLPIDAIEYVGVLVRWATGKRLTNHLRDLSLVTEAISIGVHHRQSAAHIGQQASEIRNAAPFFSPQGNVCYK